jgi:hypothetical protein
MLSTFVMTAEQDRGAHQGESEMMRLDMAGTGLTLVMLTMTAFPASANMTAASEKAPQVAESATQLQTAPKPVRSFVPANFNPPTRVETGKFTILPLGPDLVKVDFAAYMSSVEHLQKTFTRSADWPHSGISDADAMKDMETEQARFRKRESFAYSVLTKDGRRERGSVYVTPSPVPGYDAVVRLWVTKAEYDAGFDAELYAWVATWMQRDWPFAKIAYPGRAIAWEKWDSLVAASKAGNGVMPQQQQ